jgi:urocanate hydratase
MRASKASDGMGAAKFCTVSEEPEKSIKIDRKRYEKCNSNETHQIWQHMAPKESESLTIYS